LETQVRVLSNKTGQMAHVVRRLPLVREV